MGLKEGGARGSLRNVSVGVVEIPDSGVSRWEYEQTLDDSWNGYSGTANGDPQYTTTAQVGTYAREYDGSGDYDNFGRVTESEGASGWSASVWLRPASVGSNFRMVLKKAGVSDDGSWGLNLNDAGNIRWACRGSSDNSSIIGSALSASTWYHVVGTFDSGSMTLYLDGSQDGTGSISDGSLESSTGDVTVGGPNPGGYTYYNGIADDPRLYSKALSSTEVSNLYNNGSI